VKSSRPSGRRAARRTAHAAAPVAAAVACLLAAGCGSSPASGAARIGPPLTSPLATSFATAAGSDVAIVEMGGSAAQENNFWQLFVRPGPTAPWRLATPVGVADNGGLVVASGDGSLLTGFRPSQDLTYSPLASSTDNGASWSPAGPVNPGLANVPDSLAASPNGSLVALTEGGTVQLGSGSGSSWKRLSSASALAATPAGRACGLTGLTAAAFTSSGTPVLAGGCSRPGTVGIFTSSDATGGDSARWQAASPALPASLARTDIGVLRLTASGTGMIALLQAGTGSQASLVAAFWQPGSRAGSAGTWTLSAPLRTGAGQLESTTVGPGSAVGVTLSGSRGAILAGPGSAWQTLTTLPRWTATIALGPAGAVDAIGAHLGTFTDWRLQPGSGWTKAQTIQVQIPYGSSS